MMVQKTTSIFQSLEKSGREKALEIFSLAWLEGLSFAVAWRAVMGNL
jgi:hypothetical protein